MQGPLPSDPVALWSMVVDACAKQHRMRMLVGNMKLVSVEDDRAVLEVSDEMRTAAQSAERDLCTLLSVAWGQEFRVELTGGQGQTGASSNDQPRTSVLHVAPAAPAPTSPPEDLGPRTPITDHPLVKQAVELFGAKVIGTQPRRRPAES